MQEKQQSREENRPHRIDVLQRIERDTAEPQSGIVAQPKRGKAVCCLVECNCDDRGEGPTRDRVEQRAKLLIHPIPAYPAALCRQFDFWRSADWTQLRYTLASQLEPALQDVPDRLPVDAGGLHRYVR